MEPILRDKAFFNMKSPGSFLPRSLYIERALVFYPTSLPQPPLLSPKFLFFIIIEVSNMF
jgi:hypothetical protein